MIVASLLLILVAVTLLVLGLVGGSSSLLISSIVASLLAAVALVIGARHAAAARRVVTVPAGEGARAGRRPAAADDPFLDPPLAPGATRAGEEAFDADLSAGYAAGSQDAAEHLTGPDATQRVRPDADLHDDAAAGRTSSGQAAGPASGGAAPDADYDQAATVIGGARTTDPDEQSWRRDPAAADTDPALADSGAGPSAFDDAPFGARDDHAADAEVAEEFDEPDPDDPDDEPLPQAVRPADAVRVARLDAEVLVVDGRPRYHLTDCPHLVGRLTEGLPVAEAVELGFSPCGLCRPVDRLVAAAARY
jgi:hypothetical protein